MLKKDDDISRRRRDLQNEINQGLKSGFTTSEIIKRFAHNHYLSERTLWRDLQKVTDTTDSDLKSPLNNNQ